MKERRSPARWLLTILGSLIGLWLVAPALIVIPARLKATRLPDKPLALIGDQLFVANANAVLRFPYTEGSTAIDQPGVAAGRKYLVGDDQLYSMRQRIEAGELTGLRLAQQTGFEQAHISNFLNRKRGLSLEGMDKVLSVQHLSVLDLLDPTEINKRASIVPPSEDEFDAVVVADPEIADRALGAVSAAAGT